MTKRKKTRNKSKYILMFTGFGIFIPLIIVYLFFAFYFQKHYYGNTVINGTSTSNMTIHEAKDAINSQVKDYLLTIEERNGISDYITGEIINLHTVFDDSLSDILKEQKAFTWPVSIFRTHELTVNTMLNYDESLLKKYFKKLNCFDQANVINPENATISEYGTNGFEIVPEKQGAKVVEDKLFEAIRNAIYSLAPSISIEKEGCYEEPLITAENPKLQKALKKMNQIAATEITYEFGEVTEILNGEQISKWISVNEDFVVEFEENGIKEYVDYIGKTYNSFGRVREFKTSYGDVIKVSGGDYGWWLNRPEEVAELRELIRKGVKQKRTPIYFQTAQQYGKDDIGDTYVEVNLTAQHLFFYKDGKRILESDFVSGNVSKKFGTPTGTYPVQYKQNDATLVGEDYETPVKYWMPFNKNIGFHDASWRSKFGKDIYLTNGSHGCINMPPANAKKMFQNIQRGVAVVVYKLPGTETYDVNKLKGKSKTTSE